MNIEKYVIDSLEKKYELPENENIKTFNYKESGHIDSLSMIQFILDLEDKFEIEFTDEEISDSNFNIVGELIKLIESKVVK